MDAVFNFLHLPFYFLLKSMKYLLPLTLLLFFACNNQPTENAGTVPVNEELPKGFSAFYQQFHQDSAFQMDHIVFPLEGIPDNADQETIQSGTFRWRKENWSLMRPVDYQMSEYRRDFIPLTDEMVMGAHHSQRWAVRHGTPFCHYKRRVAFDLLCRRQSAGEIGY